MVEGFKDTEVGVIPNDWDVKSIAEVTTLMTNGFVGSVKSHYTDYENGILYIQGYNVEENSFNFHGIKRVTEEFHKKHMKSCLKEGDMLTIQTGDIGVTTVVPKRLVGSNCHALIITRFIKGTTDSKFYSYYFNFSVGRRRLKEIETGSTMKHINVGDMSKMLIPYPSKTEQTAIATALNDADAVIDQLTQLLTKKRNMKIGAMQELLKPKEDWEEKTLHQLADNKKELFDDGDWIEAKHITDNGIRIIQTGNIGSGCYVEKENKKYIFENSFHKLKCKLLIEGDLLVCRLAEPAGRACVLPNIGESKIVTSVDVTIFRPRIEIANRVFLANLFSTSEWFAKVSERVGGTTHKRISRSSLGKISIRIPEIEEQNRIAKIFSDMDNEINETEKKLEKYNMLKQAMMQSLLNGTIRLL